MLTLSDPKALSSDMEVLKVYKQKEVVKYCKKCKGKRASRMLADATVAKLAQFLINLKKLTWTNLKPGQAEQHSRCLFKKEANVLNASV